MQNIKSNRNIMNFGQAVEALKEGKRASREGWNGKNMWLVKFSDWNGVSGGDAPRDYKGFDDFIAMYTVGKTFVPWLASQTDILAEDWQVLPTYRQKDFETK